MQNLCFERNNRFQVEKLNKDNYLHRNLLSLPGDGQRLSVGNSSILVKTLFVCDPECAIEPCSFQSESRGMVISHWNALEAFQKKKKMLTSAINKSSVN